MKTIIIQYLIKLTDILITLSYNILYYIMIFEYYYIIYSFFSFSFFFIFLFFFLNNVT